MNSSVKVFIFILDFQKYFKDLSNLPLPPTLIQTTHYQKIQALHIFCYDTGLGSLEGFRLRFAESPGGFFI